MDRFARIQQLHRLLGARRRPVPLQAITSALECSAPTAKRVIRTMRDDLGAPIVYDREHNGYAYEAGDAAYPLPGLWFSSEELHALLAIERLLEGLGPGLLAAELTPFRARIERLVSGRRTGAPELYRRLRFLGVGQRSVPAALFGGVTQALGDRRRLELVYHSRASEQSSHREVSPQRLVNYRGNWYLDAFCHQREALRTFSLDRIARATLLDAAALDLDDDALERELASAYGIFAGPPDATAVLRFSTRLARWVAEETWHSRQQGRWLPDNRYELRIPYADATELVQDVLRYGAEVEIAEPPSLRASVHAELERAVAVYRGSDD